MESYLTVKEPSMVEIEVKRSRFIANVFPIASKEEAMEKLSQIREQHKKANHNVFAYRAGLSFIEERSSDDGEPSGTAGRPVMDVLQKTPLYNVMVIVTRYFGGTLLGANGLVRAYSLAAKTGVQKAQVVSKRLFSVLCCRLPYPLFGKVQNHIHTHKYFMGEAVFTDDVSFTVYVPTSQEDQVITELNDLTAATIEITMMDPKYLTELEGKILEMEQ